MGNLLFAEDGSSERRLRAANRPKTIVFIEGNISAGKSTLIRALKEEKYPVWEEAVDRLTKEFTDFDGRNILELFYTDMQKHSFDMQVASLATRWNIIKSALETLKEDDMGTNDVVFIERSLLTDRHTFAINLYERGCISKVQWLIYNNLLDQKLTEFEHQVSLWEFQVKTIYIKTSPDVCLERKIGRGSPEEAGVDIEYLKSLHRRLEEWQTEKAEKGESHVIDGDQDKNFVLRDVLESLA